MKKHKVLKICVTRKHILKGEPDSPDYCPIALALTDKGLEDVQVESDNIRFSDPGTGTEVFFESPKCISKFVDLFDNADYDDEGHRLERVRPFSFKIEMPVVIPGRIRCS